MRFEIELEKERLINILSEQYSQDLIAIAEFERLLDFINKTETNKEIEYIRKIIDTNETYALKEKIGYSQNQHIQQMPVILKSRLAKRRNVKTIKSISGTYELRLYDIDFIENWLTLKLKIIGGDAVIYIQKNVSIENNVRFFGGNLIMNDSISTNNKIENKLIITGKVFGGNIYIIYEK